MASLKEGTTNPNILFIHSEGEKRVLKVFQKTVKSNGKIVNCLTMCKNGLQTSKIKMSW